MTKEITYSELLQTPMWKRKREQILERDNRTCRNCGEKTGLQVHHRQYHICKATGQKKEPWSYENRYLVTLCDKCHEAGHKQYHIPQFKN